MLQDHSAVLARDLHRDPTGGSAHLLTSVRHRPNLTRFDPKQTALADRTPGQAVAHPKPRQPCPKSGWMHFFNRRRRHSASRAGVVHTLSIHVLCCRPEGGQIHPSTRGQVFRPRRHHPVRCPILLTAAFIDSSGSSFLASATSRISRSRSPAGTSLVRYGGLIPPSALPDRGGSSPAPCSPNNTTNGPK